MPFVVGEFVGPYQIVDQLGQGGMATVYKAFHADLDRFVAIKVLHLAFMEDANFLARFKREARLVAKLDHPNIVPVYDFSEADGRPYLVMKYIEGETLKAEIQKVSLQHQLLGVDEILKIATAVGAALSYAHKQGILHRDIKPSNVLVAPNGMIYLADFGLARIAQGTGSTLTSDMMVGTPQYISPEQALSQTDLDLRTDIYSFGVMLYEMIVGRVPFNADTPFAVIHDHIYSPLPLPRQLNPSVPEAVEQVLVKALAKEKNDRYPSVDAMVTSFTDALRPMIPTAETAVLQSPGNPSGVPAIEFAGNTAITEPGNDQPTIMGIDTQASPDLNSISKNEATGSIRQTPDQIDLSTAPSYTPPSVAPLRLPEVEAPDISPVKKSTKKRGVPWWGIALLVLGIIGICIFTWVVGKTAIVRVLGRQSASTPTAVLVVSTQVQNSTPAQTSGPADAMGTVQDALALWQQHDYLASDVLLNRAMRMAGDDPQFYIQAGNKMMASQTWVPASILYLGLYRIVGNGITLEQLDHLRQSLYLAAGDAQAKTLFSRNQTQPVYLIDQTRYDFLHGNPVKARNELNTIMADPTNVNNYPEAKLVQAEMQIQSNQKDQAATTLNDLLKQSALPVWIINSAKELQGKINSP